MNPVSGAGKREDVRRLIQDNLDTRKFTFDSVYTTEFSVKICMSIERIFFFTKRLTEKWVDILSEPEVRVRINKYFSLSHVDRKG